MLNSLQTIGLIRIISLFYYRFISLVFYLPRFRSCKSLTVQSSPRLTGCRFISIGTLSAGRLLRLEALWLFPKKPELTIGQNVSFGDFCHVACVLSLSISDNVLVGSNVYITDHDHGNYSDSSEFSDPDVPPALRKLSARPVSIGSNVYIGERSTILPGVSVGHGSVIGAGSVVTSDIPDFSVAAGVPCRVIKIYNFETCQWINIT